MKITELITENWSQKYKSSINCSHPKGFSQKAHCAGKKKHNESITMEAVCPDCGMCQTHGNLNEIKKGQKDSNGFTKCWPGKHAVGTKKGKNGGQVRNCEPNEGVVEGLHPMVIDDVKKLTTLSPTDRYSAYSNIRSYFKGDPELSKMASDLMGGYYEADMLRSKYKTAEAKAKYAELEPMNQAFIKQALGQEQGVAEGLDEQFDIIEDMVEAFALHHGVDPEQIWEDFESVDDQELLDESAAWRRSAGKSKKGGLNAKGVASYRRENPGSKLQMAVTTKPSKLKPGSKAAKRRKSFCARMGGVDGPMKKPNGKPTRKALALRKWNC